jgi:DNA mismatch repair protein MutS
VKSYLAELRDRADMNHVEARILDLVARLYPDIFQALARYCSRHQSYVDRTIIDVDREVHFYLAYLEHIEPFKVAGLPFCYPEVGTGPTEIQAEAAFDIALAGTLVPEDRELVCNDFQLRAPERILVVTGPNQGGKTTSARMFGQLHHLASLGLPVPGRHARLLLPDRIFTHFEREENIETSAGSWRTSRSECMRSWPRQRPAA